MKSRSPGGRTVSFAAATLTILAFLGIFSSMGQGTPGSSSATSPQRVAVLDLVRVFNEAAQILDLNDEIRKSNDDYTKEATQRRKVIEEKQLELSAFKPGSPDYEARRKNLIHMNIDANVWLKVSEQEIEQRRFDWTRVVYEKAVQAAGEIAKQRGYDLVIQKFDFKPDIIADQNLQGIQRLIRERTVVYNIPEIDITDTVIQKMNATYKAEGGKATLSATSRPSFP